MPYSVGPTTPILRIFDEHKAREFYAGFLGFAVDWEHRFEPGMPLYMQVSLGECSIHLSEHYGDGSPGVHIRVRIAAVEEYCKELQERRYTFYRPGIECPPWGGREMTVIDPFGNRICFYDP